MPEYPGEIQTNTHCIYIQIPHRSDHEVFEAANLSEVAKKRDA